MEKEMMLFIDYLLIFIKNCRKRKFLRSKEKDY